VIPITSFLAIDESEISEQFVRASGPGGQHVNTTATAVQLRFDANRSPNLPDDLKTRLRRLAGRRMTQDGVLVITADRHRSQAANRTEALERLIALIGKAAVRPAIRRATRPTLASKKRRLDAKARRGAIKADRRQPND
jgi:ribosome-associated protein